MTHARLREAMGAGAHGHKDKSPPTADGSLTPTPDTPESLELRNRQSPLECAGPSSSLLEDGSGQRPKELYGKFTWKIENFSEVSKRELRSAVFEVGQYKWYILVYPHGCDVSNHLSLFLCVADYDKLMPGWSHFAQFTIAVVNKDPKKSKYSDTLHRFSKKEHDWGWKKFMELSKVIEGFTIANTLVIKAQVQVIRDRMASPFRCLDPQYRRELVRVYLTNVEGICRRFAEEKRELLQRLHGDAAGLRSYWTSLEVTARRLSAAAPSARILKGLVKRFFSEKEVTSTLVMDALFCGCKAIEEASRQQGLADTDTAKGRGAGDATEGPAAVRLDASRARFCVTGDVLSALERAAGDSLPMGRDVNKASAAGLSGSSASSSAVAAGASAMRSSPDTDEYSQSCALRDERRLAELGRRVVQTFAFTEVILILQGRYKEAEALKRADALILEEEQNEREGAERQAARAAAERERRHRKRERRRARKEADGTRKEAASPVASEPADAAAEADERQLQQDLLSEQIRQNAARAHREHEAGLDQRRLDLQEAEEAELRAQARRRDSEGATTAGGSGESHLPNGYHRRRSPRRTASGALSDDDTPVSVSTHPSTDGSDPLTLRTLDSLDFNNEQEVLATVHLLRERIRTLEEGLSSKDEILAQQTARVQGLQGSLERAQAALHVAGKGSQSSGGSVLAQALHRQQSLEARLAQEQEAAGKLRQQLQATNASLGARTRAVDECEARIRRLTAEVAALTREVTAKDAEILALHQRSESCNGSSWHDRNAGAAASPKAAWRAKPGSLNGLDSISTAAIASSGGHLHGRLSNLSPASICSSATGTREPGSQPASPQASGEESASISMSPSRASSLDLSAGDMTPTRSGTPHHPHRRDAQLSQHTPSTLRDSIGSGTFPTDGGATNPGPPFGSVGPATSSQGGSGVPGSADADGRAESKGAQGQLGPHERRAFGSEIQVSQPGQQPPTNCGMIAALRGHSQVSPSIHPSASLCTPLAVTRSNSLPITGPMSIPGLLRPESLGQLTTGLSDRDQQPQQQRSGHPVREQVSTRQLPKQLPGILRDASQRSQNARGSKMRGSAHGPIGGGLSGGASGQRPDPSQSSIQDSHRAGSFPVLTELAGQAKGGSFLSAEGRVEMLRTTSEQLDMHRPHTPQPPAVSSRGPAAVQRAGAPVGTRQAPSDSSAVGRCAQPSNGTFVQQAKESSSGRVPFKTPDKSQRSDPSPPSVQDSPGLDDFAHMGLITDLLE
ncbi:hypothetical protein WJX74_009144 [Apatococcus lobatus]|uniref:MATH domain-containing protein n=1 Tax=Apatococcus lobatus TaxID=904363 RepID=A0AAW1QDL3_9CHLO